jgi:hypothetical protein
MVALLLKHGAKRPLHTIQLKNTDKKNQVTHKQTLVENNYEKQIIRTVYFCDMLRLILFIWR